MTAARDDEDIRWRPDKLLIPAILAGSRTSWIDLSEPDRAWVVAGLKRMGYTAEFTAERLGCAVRSVRSVWANAGVIVALYLDEADSFGDTLRMNETELRRLVKTLADAEGARDRYKLQLDRLLAVHLAEKEGQRHRCGCPITRYGTYISPEGKIGCREHRRLAVARHRQRRREGVLSAVPG